MRVFLDTNMLVSCAFEPRTGGGRPLIDGANGRASRHRATCAGGTGARPCPAEGGRLSGIEEGPQAVLAPVPPMATSRMRRPSVSWRENPSTSSTTPHNTRPALRSVSLACRITSCFRAYVITSCPLLLPAFIRRRGAVYMDPNGLANSHTVVSTPYRQREGGQWPLKRFSTTRWPCFNGVAA